MTVFCLQRKVENFLDSFHSSKFGIFNFDALTFDLRGFKFYDVGFSEKIFSDALRGKCGDLRGI